MAQMSEAFLRVIGKLMTFHHGGRTAIRFINGAAPPCGIAVHRFEFQASNPPEKEKDRADLGHRSRPSRGPTSFFRYPACPDVRASHFVWIQIRRRQAVETHLAGAFPPSSGFANAVMYVAEILVVTSPDRASLNRFDNFVT
jgi:hypothetical protein